MPRVLVTGAPGFIGRRVVARFLERGSAVTSFSLPGEGALPEWQDRVAMHHGDLAEPRALDVLTGPFDTIVHLAAPVGLAGEYERQWRVIVDGTTRVAEAAARWRSRLVVASSIAVYGALIQSETCTEETGHGPWQGAYGRAKQGQETVALQLAAAHGLPLTLIRPANVYGLGGASAWGDRLLEAIRASGGGVIGDAARNLAGLVYVENLADAIVLAATHPAAIGRTYNVCDENGVTWRRFMDDMAALVAMPPPPAYELEPLLQLAMQNEDPAALVPPRSPDLPFMEGLNLVGFDNRFDAARLRRELGWMPACGYEDALHSMRRQLGLAGPPV